MKKIISIILLIFLSVWVAFGYNPTEKDKAVLNNVYKKLDLIVEKSPKKVENLYIQIVNLKEKVKAKAQTYYLLSELENYSYKILTDRNNVEYSVKEVIDWDTVKVSYLWKDSNVRFIWIDSPESYITRFWYKECYWEEAKNYLKNLIEWKKVTLEIDESQWKTDKYNRLLAYINFNWENINNKLIEEWYAWEYTYNKAYKYQDTFKTSQNTASENQKWLWASNTCNWERLKIEEPISENTNDNIQESYACWTKTYCTQMTSCEEAKFFLNSCNLKRLDSDSDWIPCESLCSK